MLDLKFYQQCEKMEGNKENKRNGRLFIVSTPIGNLEDITLRALKILKEVDIIAAEDTRRTKILLSHYEIRKPLISYFEHNKIYKGKLILEDLMKGKNVALVTDAGTPGISDPGYLLIRQSIEQGIDIVPICGISALNAALCVSGLPTNRFSFLGFLPIKKNKRRLLLEKFKESEETLIMFESPRRIIKTLMDIKEVIGDRNIAICRELTKMYEEIFRGKISDAFEEFSKKESIRGEFTLVVGGAKSVKRECQNNDQSTKELKS